MEIGFNSKFMLEMLNNVDTKQIRLELSTPTRAGVLTPDVQEENESLLMLVMPIMINNY
jgi:DNA polymerase-3 subunit beta